MRKGKQIFPTEKGTQLIAIVPGSLKSPKTTAEWETVLQHIEHGNSPVSAAQFTEQIEEQTRSLVRDYCSSAPAETDPENNLKSVKNSWLITTEDQELIQVMADFQNQKEAEYLADGTVFRKAENHAEKNC